MGVFTIIPFLQYYLEDIMEVSNPPLMSSLIFVTIVLCSVPSSIIAGPLSDKYGRKPMVYISCFVMSFSNAFFIFLSFFPNLAFMFITASIFGIGYGAYQSVDWALALDAIPEGKDIAKDMGIWHISIVIPQVIAPLVIGGMLSTVKHTSYSLAYGILFIIATFWFVLGGIFIFPVNIIKNKRYQSESRS